MIDWKYQYLICASFCTSTWKRFAHYRRIRDCPWLDLPFYRLERCAQLENKRQWLGGNAGIFSDHLARSSFGIVSSLTLWGWGGGGGLSWGQRYVRITSRVTAPFVTDARECRWAYSCVTSRKEGSISSWIPMDAGGEGVLCCTEAAVAVFSPLAINMPLWWNHTLNTGCKGIK